MKKDILSMGYREITENHWAKPVGYSLYVVSFIDNQYKFINYFVGIDDHIYVYESKVIEDLRELKQVESWAKQVNNGVDSQFQFLNQEEIYGMFL